LLASDKKGVANPSFSFPSPGHKKSLLVYDPYKPSLNRIATVIMIFTTAYIVLGTLLGAQALLNSNLNYQSPSRRQEHAILSIDIPLVERRAWKRNPEEYAPDELNFTHGIASGDPWLESIILWTRIAPTVESDKKQRHCRR
jgi:hypothetical protein